jgi:hypothetical protein
MFVPESEWGGLEGVNNKVDSGGGSSSVSGGDGMHCEVGENPGEGVDNALGRDFCDPDTVTQQVVASGRFKIPPVKSMWRPSAADGRLPVDEDAGGLPGGARGVAVEVKEAVDLGPGRVLGIDAGAVEKVRRLEGLRKEAIPKDS